MEIQGKLKLKQIIIEVDELQNKGKMTIEGDVIVGGLSLFGNKPFSIKFPIEKGFAEYIHKEIKNNVGDIIEELINKTNGAE